MTPEQQEILRDAFQLILIYVPEFDYMTFADAHELACERDAIAAEQLGNSFWTLSAWNNYGRDVWANYNEC